KVNIKNTEPKATGVPIKNGGSGSSVNGRQGRTEGGTTTQRNNVTVNVAGARKNGDSDAFDTGSELDSLNSPDSSSPGRGAGSTAGPVQGTFSCNSKSCNLQRARVAKRAALANDFTVATKAAQAAEPFFVEKKLASLRPPQEKIAKEAVDLVWKQVGAVEEERRIVDTTIKESDGEVTTLILTAYQRICSKPVSNEHRGRLAKSFQVLFNTKHRQEYLVKVRHEKSNEVCPKFERQEKEMARQRALVVARLAAEARDVEERAKKEAVEVEKRAGAAS
ncbi:hypothetical protein HDU76_013067, partial [Blyttiomyces sp. JEL0837]